MSDPTPDGLLAEFSEPQPFTLDVAYAAPAVGGVHVVLEDDEVIYVGETGNLRQRLRQHLRGNRGSSVLHQQVGAALDTEDGEASAEEIAGWLAERTVRWHLTDQRKELKAVLVERLAPRLNRQGSHHPPVDEEPDEPPSVCEWVYPANEQSEYWGEDLGVLETFRRVRNGDIAEWGLATCHQQITAGDRIWIYATRPYQRLVAAGIAWSDPYEQINDDGAARWEVAIRWDVPLTRYLLANVIAGSEVLEVRVQTVRALRPAESARLADLLDRRQAPGPEELPEGRRHRLAQVTARQGQPDFRRRLIEAYGGRCAITCCDVEAVLQAAHISPYDGPATNRVDNGLLLRADLHNLFDRGLIWIDGSYRVRLAAGVEHYAEHDRQRLLLPVHPEDRPSKEALRQHRIEIAGQRER